MADRALLPLMHAIGGFRRDSLQETHFWHGQPFPAERLDASLCVTVEGTDPSRHTNRLLPLPLFHMPVLGGWTHYVVLEAANDGRPWHVGWQHLHHPDDFRASCKLNRLALGDARVRVLSLPTGYLTRFFAMDGSGAQRALRVVDRGCLGDGRHGDIRLL